jgi:hypothetical protein
MAGKAKCQTRKCPEDNTANCRTTIGESPLSFLRRGAGGEVPPTTELQSEAQRQTRIYHRRRRHCEAKPPQNTTEAQVSTGFASSCLLAMTAEAILCLYQNPSWNDSLSPSDCFGVTSLVLSEFTHTRLAMTVHPGCFYRRAASKATAATTEPQSKAQRQP